MVHTERWHYIKAGSSLCGKYIAAPFGPQAIEDSFLKFDAPERRANNCKTCERRILELNPA